MEAFLRLPRWATYADYLAAEQTSERRHEFFDGAIGSSTPTAGR